MPLFHGTSEDSARAVVAGGFRLPSSAGMFGRGLYFADCPLKSLQYASLPLGLGACCGERYMLVCSVELGHTKLRTSAKNELDPEIDLKPSSSSRRSSAWPRCLRSARASARAYSRGRQTT